jgi:hypothetical protein
MKAKRFFTIMLPILAAVTLTASQCGGNEPEHVIIPITNFNIQNYGCSTETMQSNSVYVINSEEEFAEYYNCETDPQIDFSKKTLLVTYGYATYGISNIATELSKKDNVYFLTVDITLGDATVVERWHIAVIADKINTQNVMLNVNFIRP